MFVCKRDERAALQADGGDGVEDAAETPVVAVVQDSRQMPSVLLRPALVPALLVQGGRNAEIRSRRSSNSRTPTTTAAEREYLVMLRATQQLIAELLDVHALSSAIEYRTNEPIAVNAREWWRHVQQRSIIASQKRKRFSGVAGGGSECNGSSGTAGVVVKQALPDLISGLSGDSLPLQDVYTEALFRILQGLDRVNRRKAAPAAIASLSNDRVAVDAVVMKNVDGAIAYAAGELLESWEAAMDEMIVGRGAPSPTDVSVVVINMVLQFYDIGSLHAFHPHVLVASSVRRVFGRATNWKCSVCSRFCEVKGPAAAPMVYRCAACDFNLCKECFTRIPNQSKGSESAVGYVQKKLRVGRFFQLAFRHIAESASFKSIAGKLGFELRQRVKELPIYRAVEIAAGAELLADMLACPAFALQVVKHTDCDWFPVYMNTWMMGFLSFLGPFIRGTSISDEVRAVNVGVGADNQAAAKMALGVEWQDGYRLLKQNFMSIMRSLLSISQHPYVADATLSWLGCTVLSTNKRRRMSRETNDMLDGFLINISTILVLLSLPNLDEEELNPGLIDSSYHAGSLSLRAFGDKNVREAPLRDLASIRGEQYVADKLREEEDRLQKHDRRCIQDYRDYSRRTTAKDETRFYPIRDSHYGVACNQCYQQNFQGVRYKCAFCDDIDICGSCFELFSQQSTSARGRIDGVLTTGLESPQVHMLDHVFIRVGTPVPLYETRHFEMIKFEKEKFRAENNSVAAAVTTAAVGEESAAVDLSLQCADCGCSLKKVPISFKCSNCFDPRFVCADCVAREEYWRDPHKMHAPGHLYFAITSSWRFTYSPNAPALHYRSLSHPSALLPREPFNQETELFYMAIKSMHYGPLLTLSKLISTLKELQDLQAFCYCEEEQLKYETKQRRSSRNASRRPLKMSSHYGASKARIADLEATKCMTELHLLEVSNVTEWLTFYAKSCRWLLRIASPSQNAYGELLTDLSDAFIQFPEHFFSDLCDIVYLLGLDRIEYHAVIAEFAKMENSEMESGGDSVAEPILIMLTQLVASRELTRNPHLRVQALKALMALLSFFSKSKHNHAVKSVFERNSLLQEFMVPGILKFHEEMENYHVRNNGLAFNSNASSGDHLLWGFLPTRVSVTFLLRYLWQIPNQRKAITNLFHLGNLASPQSSASAASGQLSVLVSGLWSDVAKLLDEGTSKIDTLLQLREIQESVWEGNLVSLPFRPAMMDGYIALHSKQLRLTFRMLVEALELLSWMGDSVPFKKVMLKPELSEQCARIVSFLVSSIGTANESNSWKFSVQLLRDGKLVLANLVMLVVRCSGLSDKCSASSFWKLIQESGSAMANCIGDLDTRERWALNSVTTRLESARFLCETVDEESATDGDDVSSQDDVVEEDDDEEIDEDEALALLEKQAADAVVAARQTSASRASSRASQAESIARHLGKRFVSSLAKDGRFDYKRFVGALDMLRRSANSSSEAEYVYVDSSWVLMFLETMKKCREMIELHASMDEFLGEIPEEYLDPLLNTIMTDPVCLPSGQILDRSVIERHLLSSQHVDPFTREPLTVEMLVPCDALRREIRLYLQSKMKHFMKNDKEDVLATWGLGWNYLFDGDGAAGED